MMYNYCNEKKSVVERIWRNDRMKWKKWLALLMAAVMTLSMAACSKDAGSAGSAGTEGGSNESSGWELRRTLPLMSTTR